MLGVFIFTALFAMDNAVFLKDVEKKQDMNCTFTYTGKQQLRPDVPHIAFQEKYIFFTMEPCNEGGK